MTFQVPKEYVEPREIHAKMVSFWAKPTVIERLDAICDVSHIERSEILRLLVDLFLNDLPFQDKIMEMGRRNHV